MEELYFAYGSNLNSADFRNWCAGNGREYPLVKFANAFIPDMRLVFNYNSAKRGGGVLNIRNQFGNAVPGTLFRVAGDEKGWETLDKKELAPTIHHKLKVTALTENGQAHDAVTFLVSASQTEGLFVPPAENYVKIVEQGYAEQGLDRAADFFREIAAGKEPPWYINHLFVYGTFMKGESRNHILKSTEVIDFEEPATVRGELYDTGKGYPALAPVALAADGPMATGELFQLKNPRAAFEILDIVEDFRGYGSGKSVYRRAVIRTSTQSGRSITAWVYMLDGSAEKLALIKSGNWRKP